MSLLNNADTTKLTPRVSKTIVEFLIENKGYIKSEGDALAEMRTMNNYSLLDAYLNWIGIQGYTDEIMAAVRCIDDACRKG